MSDTFTCLPFEQLLEWIKQEEPGEKLFGIPKSLFFTPDPDDPFRVRRYGTELESPIGVAAGPHTQLSQNILAAWLTGARYIELKTVQVLDELDITKPCINMADEGYNCEWSQELKLESSHDEYLNALIAIHLLRNKWGWADDQGPGFIFNMSVGYNLEGILSQRVQQFLDAMTDASDRIGDKLETVAALFPEASDITIPKAISDNVTISTMHGCPPDEIEKIGRYFIEDRELNTTIKLNPTLLGPDALRGILNDTLGFEAVTVPDIAFEHDLEYDAGVSLIRNLSDLARKVGVEFNLKLTNTLETANTRHLLPEKEQMLYMSGRPLHVISVNLARKLQETFNGALDISFCAGADGFNLTDLLKCGLAPVTVCSDILKPGGYGRLAQYLTRIRSVFNETGARSMADYIQNTIDAGDDDLQQPGTRELESAVLANLASYAEGVKQHPHYHKKSYPWNGIKTDRTLPRFDCIDAPCKRTCPTGQDVPGYMRYTARGEFKKAFGVILDTNPFPHVQGMVCDHPCTHKCTRINYDTPLKIREIKRFVAQNSPGIPDIRPKPDNGLTAAVIGGGPSGFSAAYFLRVHGFKVDLFEAKSFPGGMAADAIPSFRLDDLSIQKDIDRIISMGVKVRYDARIEPKDFDTIRSTYDYVYIGVGAARAFPLEIPGSDGARVYDQLSFLSSVRQNRPVDTGREIVVIGGGNSAMDAARTAHRLARRTGDQGRTTIIYRRSISQMPADPEEIQDALEEGIEIIELCSPSRIIRENGNINGIQCQQMTLQAPDESGRPRPVPIEGAEVLIPADTLITAIGQEVVIPFLQGQSLDTDPATLKTVIPDVYAGGDAIRGVSTLIRAIGDGRTAARSILQDSSIPDYTDPDQERITSHLSAAGYQELEQKMAVRTYGPAVPTVDPSSRMTFDLTTRTMSPDTAMAEAARCLSCDTLCDICTTVCPNRANVSYTAEPCRITTYKATLKRHGTVIEPVGTFKILQARQVINLGDFCNMCGNCTTFCPSSGAPYLDKPTFYLGVNTLENEAEGYCITYQAIHKKTNAQWLSLTETDTGFRYDTSELCAQIDRDDLSVNSVEWKTGSHMEIDLGPAAELGILYRSLRQTGILRVAADREKP